MSGVAEQFKGMKCPVGGVAKPHTRARCLGRPYIPPGAKDRPSRWKQAKHRPSSTTRGEPGTPEGGRACEAT